MALMATDPIRVSIEDKLFKRGHARLRREWTKAVERLDTDPEGAITAARTLLESTCKHILSAVGEPYDTKADLPDLYNKLSNVLGIAPSGHTDRLYRQFFGSTHAIVQAVGELRNKVGDAHGKGQQAIAPSRAQAELAVNLSGAVATFLLTSMESHLSATRRLTPSGEAILKFDKGTVWRLVDHAENSSAHFKAWGERKPKPALWLVGDAGVYLMSNGQPPLLHDGRTAKAPYPVRVPRLTAHADGCDWMDEVDDWWPIHNAISGGDDFSITIALKLVRRALELAEAQIVIVCGPDNFVVLADAEYEDLGERSPFDKIR